MKRGFTVIELLICLAIAGILLTVAINGIHDTRHAKHFKLANGVVACRSYFVGPCGVSLERCEDGKRYECQNNVEVLPQ